MPTELRISGETMAAVVAHALADHPREAVGLLGGAGSGVPAGSGTFAEPTLLVRHHPLVNERDIYATTGFLVKPGAFAAAVRWLNDAGLYLGALYHSHTRSGVHSSDAQYSVVDCRWAALGLPQLIVAVRARGQVVDFVEARAWLPRTDRRSMDELVLHVLSDAAR